MGEQIPLRYIVFLYCGKKAFLARKNVLFIDNPVNSRPWTAWKPYPVYQPLLIAETALNAIILDNKDKLTLICKF